MDVVYERVGHFHGNQIVCIINHNTVTGYKQKSVVHFTYICKIHHTFSVVSSLSNACPQPESALTHLRGVRVNLYRAQLLWILCTVILMGWYIQSSRKKSILEIFVDQIMLKAAALISYF